uniref:Cytokine receptor-like factor 2 n=1 Tax=Loxodonta africana TaxID=9785 RepID=G3U3N4_LOXAF
SLILFYGSFPSLAEGFSSLCQANPEEAVQLQIINFNFETVWVTWNASEYPGTNLTFSYKHRFRGATMSQCHNYTLDQGYTSGCVLEVEPDEDGTRDVILELSLCNKTRVLLNYSVWISEYLKPSSPKDLTFLWRQETVTVRCSNLSYNGLLYQIQYKSNFDSEWESTERRTCSIAIENLDTDKCYYFRARVKTMESRYGPETYPSDWSEVTQWQGGEQKGSCGRSKTTPARGFLSFFFFFYLPYDILIIMISITLHAHFRVKNLLMPSVPDPKFTFSRAFLRTTEGTFQEWIKFTENVAPVNKVENEEEDCALEEVPVVQLVKAKVEAPMTGPLCPQMQMGEALGPGLHPLQPPQHSDVVTLGGFSFVVDDDAYLML